jgi:hypothetical protein
VASDREPVVMPQVWANALLGGFAAVQNGSNPTGCCPPPRNTKLTGAWPCQVRTVAPRGVYPECLTACLGGG